MQLICPPDLCTGCSACANTCMQSAISMQKDKKGFLRPIVDQDQCVDCGRCKDNCPQANREEPQRKGKLFAALAIDDSLRSESSSGGLFSLFAEQIIEEGGIVFGASMEPDLSVHHIAVNDYKGLPKLRGSKYVQSELGSSFQETKHYLELGKPVLFSGTPCQIDGLYHFLGKEYRKLLTIDILCHGVPSQAVLDKFVACREKKKGSKAVSINFRDKDPGWASFSTSILYEDGTKEVNNSYYYSFVRNYCLRDSCANCLYASTARIGDLTLGDFWGYRESAPEHIENDDLGISLVGINTEKGSAAFRKIKSRLDCAQREWNDALKGNPGLLHPAVPHEKSPAFWEDFISLEWDALAEKYELPRGKKTSFISSADRKYYAKPYKQRHRHHVIHCAKSDLLRKLGR